MITTSQRDETYLHDRAFKTRWVTMMPVPAGINTADLTRVPVDMLRIIYPKVYHWGPNYQHMLDFFTRFEQDLTGSDHDQAHIKRLLDLGSIYLLEADAMVSKRGDMFETVFERERALRYQCAEQETVDAFFVAMDMPPAIARLLHGVNPLGQHWQAQNRAAQQLVTTQVRGVVELWLMLDIVIREHIRSKGCLFAETVICLRAFGQT